VGCFRGAKDWDGDFKKWTCLKSATKKMAAGVKKSIKATGGGPEFVGDVSFVDGRILHVIGSVAVQGVSGGFDSALVCIRDIVKTSYVNQ